MKRVSTWILLVLTVPLVGAHGGADHIVGPCVAGDDAHNDVMNGWMRHAHPRVTGLAACFGQGPYSVAFMTPNTGTAAGGYQLDSWSLEFHVLGASQGWWDLWIEDGSYRWNGGWRHVLGQSIKMDWTPPMATIAGPVGSERGGTTFISPTGSLRTEASDSHAGVSTRQVYVNGDLVQTDSGSGTRYVQGSRFPSEGVHDVHYIVKDAAGLDTTTFLRVGIDGSAPELLLSTPAPIEVNARGATLKCGEEFEASASEVRTDQRITTANCLPLVQLAATPVTSPGIYLPFLTITPSRADGVIPLVLVSSEPVVFAGRVSDLSGARSVTLQVFSEVVARAEEVDEFALTWTPPPYVLPWQYTLTLTIVDWVGHSTIVRFSAISVPAG